MEENRFRQEKRKLALMRVISLGVTASFLLLLAMAAAVISGLGKLQDMAIDVQMAAAELSAVTEELALVDWDALAQTVEEAALSASSGLDSAVETLETLDLSTLNDAVTELSEAVGPIAEFARRFE